jgi:hypothetical protein
MLGLLLESVASIDATSACLPRNGLPLGGNIGSAGRNKIRENCHPISAETASASVFPDNLPNLTDRFLVAGRRLGPAAPRKPQTLTQIKDTSRSAGDN